MFESYNSHGTNEASIEKMKHILCLALQCELTQRQRQCLELYYYENMKKYEIADALSISPSTVSRHIKAAERKLKSVAKYY
ncbi:MAG: sigma-70 family RNA polymerase sigma factor [Ruminococcus sp.]|nr:sigma-70 family RNA polymerase sigma factor [Ruminococcus sp.]